MERACEYYPILPSPFSAGSLGMALLAGLTLSGFGTEQASHIKPMQLSGASNIVYIEGNHLSMVAQQDYNDLALFSNFSLGLSKRSVEMPDFFFDVLEKNFDSLLA